MLKKIIVASSLFLAGMLSVSAQNDHNKWGLSIFANLYEYNGDLENRFFTFKNLRENAGVGFGLTRYLSPSFDANGHFSYGKMDGAQATTAKIFGAEMFTTDLGLRYKFYNGKILKKEALIGPYVDFGTGATFAHTQGNGSYLANFDEKYLDLNFNAGLGVRVRLAEQVYAFAQTKFHYYLNDKYDGSGHPWSLETNNNVNDAYLEHSVGFLFEIGKPKDTDNDGVSDRKDECPDTPEGVKVDAKGCPVDTDGDGVADYQDECPEFAGTVAFKGCPDTDGDGIRDIDDECADVAGLAKFNGCPDTDGDGVKDSEDECPQVAGLLKFNGCPDVDGDGVDDRNDKCLSTPAGYPVNADGCAKDTDGDGVVDGEDICVTTAGEKENRGCPVVKEEVKERLSYAAEHVNFELGSSKLTPASVKIMEEVAEIMNDYPEYELTISGYTDALGDDAKNLQLSKDRAHACEQKLAELGISEDRMSDEGYGEADPIASNKTRAGRAKNRRVEFELVLPE